MKNRLACAIVGSVLLSLASLTFAQALPQATAVRVYDATELDMAHYTLIKRLWVDTWWSAFEIRRYPTPAAGTQALADAARSLGADGLVNVTCIPSNRFWSGTAYRCYGNAVRVKPR